MASKKIPRICEQCGKSFEIWPYRVKDGHGRFCSMPCQRISRRSRMVLSCENCNKEFEVPPSKWRDTKFCSRSCWDENRTIPLAIRFQRYIGPTTGNGCVLWIGASNKDGRGIINSGPPKNERLSAPTVAFELAGGILPKGHGILHHCDNPPCINVEHFFTGTMADNMADKQAKGRTPHGEVHCCAVLTESQVLDAKRRYDNGEGTYKELAPDYGVHHITLGDAIAGRTWKHLKSS